VTARKRLDTLGGKASEVPEVDCEQDVEPAAPALAVGSQRRLPTGRLALGWVMLSGLMVLLAAVIGHAYRMLMTKGAELRDLQEDATTERVVIPAQRGFIYDRLGRPLATSELVYSCHVDPKMFAERAAKSKRAATLVHDLADALSLKQADVEEVFRKTDKSFVWLKRRITEAEREAVERVKQTFRAGEIGLRKESMRRYPQGATAAHVVGFVNVDGPQEGVERTWDKWLAEDDGFYYAKVDSAGRPIELLPMETRSPQHGRSLMLTIDLAIQQKAEQVLADTCAQYGTPSASAIVLDCRTGEVLALANYPTYDPNTPGDFPADNRKNRALTDPYEPGSTFKVFVAAAALSENVTRLGQTINCEGGLFSYKGRRLHDHHPYGGLTFEQVVAKSSNIGMAKLGLAMGDNRLHDSISAFGFGRTTGIDLPGESRGLLYPVARWSGTSVLSVSMGQELSVTPMQLARGFAAIASGGKLLRPRVVRSVNHPQDGSILLDLSGRAEIGTSLGASACRLMIDPVLTLVVKEGTGTKARLTNWRSFGKTGTAQISKRGGGYEENLYVGSYIAGAPVRNPRLVVMVNLNRVDKTKGGYYGGTVAAPAVKSILEFALPYLNVPSDGPEELTASASAPSHD